MKNDTKKNCFTCMYIGARKTCLKNGLPIVDPFLMYRILELNRKESARSKIEGCEDYIEYELFLP